MGKNLLILPECPSTNTFAAELSQSGQAPEGTVIIAHNQTAGRGQRGNTWEAGKGLNLTLSVILHPVFLKVPDQFLLNKAVSLAVQALVQTHTDLPVRVKWPNDIMIGDRKTCGILIENQITGDKLNRSIVGIGLNVNQTEFSLPGATSISVGAKKTLELPKVFEDLLQSIEWRYLQLKSNQTAKLNEDYKAMMYWINEPHHFLVDNEMIVGIIRGVDENGKLIADINNTLRSFDLKQIKYLN